MEHLSGTCPQFNRHTISGVGIPIAVQLMTNVNDGSTITWGGGDSIMIGGAIKKEKNKGWLRL